jgi:GAF domain-containing protein
VQTKAGSLLEHFAQLAANVAGTSAAVVGVPGRHHQQEPTLAAFGLSRDRLSMCVEIDRIFDSGPSLTVVPDLTQEERFAGRLAAFEHPLPRFLGHHKLLAPGGRRIGFVCVLDQDPRPGLTDAEAASLG